MKLLNGDCLEILPSIESKSVDLVFCDLPYGQIGAKWDIPIALDKLWVELKRVAKDDHTPFIFTCTTKFGFKLIESNETWFRYDLVICKQGATGHLASHKQPMRKHEMIYIFSKKGANYYVDDHHTRVKESLTKVISGDGNVLEKRENPYTSGGQFEPTLPNSLFTSTLLEPTLPSSLVNGKDNVYAGTINKDGWGKHFDIPLPNSLVDSKIVNYKKRTNSTQKCEKMLAWILKYYTREGDTVLDPTMGSGSLGKACKEMKRDFIGIELREDQYKKAVEYIG